MGKGFVTARFGDVEVKSTYGVGERVFHRMALGRIPGLVTGIKVFPGGAKYLISWGDNTETEHYALELTRDYTPDYGDGAAD